MSVRDRVCVACLFFFYFSLSRAIRLLPSPIHTIRRQERKKEARPSLFYFFPLGCCYPFYRPGSNGPVHFAR